MNLIRPSATAKSFPIGARFTGKHRLVHDVDSGLLSESLPPIHGHAETIQRLLLTKVPERRVSLLDKLGVYLPKAVSQKRPVKVTVDMRFKAALDPQTGVMQ